MFQNARIKLTAWYLLIIMAISLSFSAVIFKMLTFEMDRFAERQQMRIERELENAAIFPAPPKREGNAQYFTFDPAIMHETKERLLTQLLIINAAIAVISSGLGYVLAGKTLHPIATMLEEQRRFVSDASHELRTPLTALRSSIEVALRDKNLTIQDAKTVLKDNAEDVHTLQTLTDQLLELARLEQNGTKHQHQHVNLQTVAEQAIKRVFPIAKKRNIIIKEHLESALTQGNNNTLIDCCVVLLDNAIKYSAKNTTVRITTITEGNDALIRIEDTGIGISATDLPHIFDRFYRADSARSKSNTKGYGLGLSIAKKIIEEHHGNIQVQSTIHKGSTFTISLPAIPDKKSV